jgi:hypothetical protein
MFSNGMRNATATSHSFGSCVDVGGGYYSKFNFQIGALSPPGEGEYVAWIGYGSDSLIDWGMFELVGKVREAYNEYVVYECIQGMLLFYAYAFHIP